MKNVSPSTKAMFSWIIILTPTVVIIGGLLVHALMVS